jgi:predicted transcriptional regulator
MRNHLAPVKQQSLIAWILTALEALSANNALNIATSSDIRLHMAEVLNRHYPVQTIIVVLNRLMKQGLVIRRALGPEERMGVQRYGYYLACSFSQARRDTTCQIVQLLLRELYANDVAAFQRDAMHAFSSVSVLLPKRAHTGTRN